MSDTLDQLAADIETALPGLPTNEIRLVKAAAALLRGDVEACLSVCDVIVGEQNRAAWPKPLREMADALDALKGSKHDPAA